ncbi:MAG: hypothetical protein NTX50_09625 [Candidatus Sumerlaeota bacterium]|nr:hypothetical protein [Candidatus Sumerlaeota bacterium]
MPISIQSPLVIRWLWRAASLAIAGFWLTMMSFLLIKEIWPGRTLGQEKFIMPEAFAANWQDMDEWMEVRYKDLYLGVAHTQIQRVTGGYYLAGSRLRLALPFGILRMSLQADGTALLDAKMTLETAALDCEMLSQKIRFEAAVSGDALYYSLSNNGTQAGGGRLLLAAPPSLYPAARSMLARNFKLQEGQTYDVQVFDPLWTFGSDMVRMRVGKREQVPLGGKSHQMVTAFKIETTMNDIKSYSWVDDEGRTVRHQMGKDLILSRIESAEARRTYPEMDKPLQIPIVNNDQLRSYANSNPNFRPNNGALMLLRNAISGKE